ncbi:MAG: extracellular solute-binding protein [Desulfobacterales bacterium]|nr:extracellular solute-binding protein [Desulfobacterales bacterium]
MKKLMSSALFLVVLGLLAAQPGAAQNYNELEKIPQALIDGAKKEGKMVWWGTDSSRYSSKIINAFNKKYPFIKIAYTDGMGTEFGDRILMEADAGVCTVDLVNGADSFLPQMTARGVVKHIGDLPFFKIWPQGAKDPKGYWFGMNSTRWVLGYNTRDISSADVPKTYDEIVDPKWKGQFAIEERPDQWFLGLWLDWGQEKTTKTLKKVMANNPHVGKGYSALTELLMAGEFKFFFPVQDYKIVQFQDKKAPIGWVPLRPTEVTFQGAHIMKKAPHPHAVELFIRWLTSLEGQTIYNKVTHKASLHPGMATKAPLGVFPKDTQYTYRTPESYELLAPGTALRKTWDQLVHGM